MEESMFIKEIMVTIKKYLWLIILLAVIGGVAGKFLASNGQPPTYKNTSLVLLEKQNDKTAININQPDDYNRFLNTAQTLVNTPVILKSVKSELGLKDSLSKLSGEVNPTIENGSQIINITVETSNAKQTTKIANKTADVFARDIKNYLNVKSAQVVEQAQSGHETQVLHSRSKASMVMGVIIGLVIGVVIAFILGSFGRTKKAV
jgi:capsular polysaccharide biosynthesis protein